MVTVMVIEGGVSGVGIMAKAGGEKAAARGGAPGEMIVVGGAGMREGKTGGKSFRRGDVVVAKRTGAAPASGRRWRPRRALPRKSCR